MSFWQRHHHWSTGVLPGSAFDTALATEQAIAQTPIWAIDDLAPSSNARQSEQQQAIVENAVRGTHNGSNKRRSSPELSARQVFPPKAVFLSTMENELSVRSAVDRTITVRIGAGSFDSAALDRMNAFNETNRAPARLTVAAIQMLQYRATLDGWSTLLADLSGLRKKYESTANEVLSRHATAASHAGRHVPMAADLVLGFAPLQMLAQATGHQTLLALLDPDADGNLIRLTIDIVAESFRSQSEATPGKVLLACIRDLLASGEARIDNPLSPGSMPGVNSSMATNRGLGWWTDSDGRDHSGSHSIGVLTGSGRGKGGDVVMLNAKEAFRRAQRAYPDRLPSGTKTNETFAALWSEKLIHAHYLALGQNENRVDRPFFIEKRQMRGVPIHIDDILSERSAEEVGLPRESE